MDELVIVRDCLMVNDNIICKVEQALESQRGLLPGAAKDNVPTVFSMSCMSHSCVLAMRPVYERVEGLNSYFVRLGHLCASSRLFGKMIKAIEAIVEKTFRFRLAPEMPAEAGRWRSAAEDVLRLTSCSLDLSEDIVEQILLYDSGDWSIPEILHTARLGVRAGERRRKRRAS